MEAKTLEYMNIKIYSKNYKFFLYEKGLIKWTKYDYSREMKK